MPDGKDEPQGTEGEGTPDNGGGEGAGGDPDGGTSGTDSRAQELQDSAKGRKPDARHYGDWKGRFLENLALMPNVRAAAEEAGVSRTQAFRVRSQDPEFAQAWEAAIQEGVDRLEQEAWRRAVVGYERPVFGNQGEGVDPETKEKVKLGTGVVGSVTEYDSRLMQQLLIAHRPEKYRPQIELTADQGQIDAKIQAAAARLLEMARARQAELAGGPPVIEAEVVQGNGKAPSSSNGQGNVGEPPPGGDQEGESE